jgi:hypothetical protein
MPQLLDRLHDEWQYLAQSLRATRTLAQWATDPGLRGFSDLEEVVAEIQRRGRPAESDRLLLALPSAASPAGRGGPRRRGCRVNVRRSPLGFSCHTRSLRCPCEAG